MSKRSIHRRSHRSHQPPAGALPSQGKGVKHKLHRAHRHLTGIALGVTMFRSGDGSPERPARLRMGRAGVVHPRRRVLPDLQAYRAGVGDLR